RRDAPRGRSGGLPPLPHRGGLHPLGPPTGRAALRLADRNLRVPRRRSRHRPALRERRSAQGGGGGALAVRARRRVGGASGAFPGAARATPPLRGTSMRVALFGGAFDPPHVGHLLVTAYVLATEEVDRVWLMPAYAHAFEKKMSPFPHRLEMCLILANLFRKGVDATSVESEIGGKGYTVDTIRFLQARYPSFQFHLVIGSDILAETHAWKDIGT